MGLCFVCQSIDFNNLPSLPAHYETYHRESVTGKADSGLLAFFSPRLREEYKAGRDVDEGEFSQPLGVAHHQSITELTAAAQNCSICRLVEREVSGYLAARAEAEKDKVFTYYQKKKNLRGPDYRLWLAKRRDGGEGFLVVSPDVARSTEVPLLAAVGFCVEGNSLVSIC
jgi:hypothetical protein